MDNRSSHRSFFWPVVLIGVGVIWLLANLGLLPTANLAALARLWPLLLIAAGLDLLFARRFPLIGALLGLATVAAAILLLLAAPRLGLANNAEVRSEQFNTPLAGASSARVMLDFWSDRASVGSLPGSENLVEVDSTHTGQVNFQSSGDQEKTIRLSHSFNDPLSWIGIGQDLHTDVRLSPHVPLDLSINIGSGSARLDLRDLQLSNLEIDGGSGSSGITLPAMSNPLPARVQSGSGSMDLAIPSSSRVTLRADTGSGSFDLDIPDEAAVRVEVRDSGSGSLSLPSGMAQVERSGDEEGVWETANFAGSDHQIVVTFEDVGSGSISVH
jgi:hypothetical protein